MKCKRCGNQMERRKVAQSTFEYVCPRCHFRVGANTKSVSNAEAKAEEGEDRHTSNASSNEEH